MTDDALDCSGSCAGAGCAGATDSCTGAGCAGADSAGADCLEVSVFFTTFLTVDGFVTLVGMFFVYDYIVVLFLYILFVIKIKLR